MIPIMTNKDGIKTFETLPIPSSTFLWEMYHKTIHIKITQMVVGTSKNPALAKSELPPTVVVK